MRRAGRRDRGASPCPLPRPTATSRISRWIPASAIGLDAPTPEDRRAVEEAIRSKEDFLARISDPSRVFRLRPNDPYFALKVTPRLRLIYTREGDRISVEDPDEPGLPRSVRVDREAMKPKPASEEAEPVGPRPAPSPS